MFDKKRTIVLLKMIILVLFLILITMLIRKVIARFETEASTTAEIQTAFFFIGPDYQTMTINLGDIQPQDQEYTYTFSVSNNNGSVRTETALEYDLTMTTTTNIPLTYELYLNENYRDVSARSIITPTTITDAYGTYFKKFEAPTEDFGYASNETNVYTLVIRFPKAHKSNPKYQNTIDGIKIEIVSRQKIAT